MQHPPSAKPSSSRMRIADIINLPEDPASDDCGTPEMTNLLRQPSEASCGLACVSPPRMVSQLMQRIKDRGRPTQWKERGQREKEMLDQPRNVRCSQIEATFDHTEESALAGPSSSDTEECGEVAMSNMGAARILLDLIASSKDEISKFREVRLEMQLLVHNAKEESQRRNSGCEKYESEESIGSCLTNLEEAPSCSNVTSSRSNTTFPYVLITREENGIISEKERPGRMELLEAELEAELELLQIHCDAESCPESIKVDDLKLNDVATSSEEVVNPTDGIYDGVPPVELERRLHELLQSQQKEKIKELESAVECLKKKLREKEGEVLWWKDTALLVSRHVPELQGRW